MDEVRLEVHQLICHQHMFCMWSLLPRSMSVWKKAAQLNKNFLDFAILSL